MSLVSWDEDKSLGKTPCKTEHQTWQCPNMKPIDGDDSFTHEHYECKMCGKKISLDYDEMR